MTLLIRAEYKLKNINEANSNPAARALVGTYQQEQMHLRSSERDTFLYELDIKTVLRCFVILRTSDILHFADDI